MNHYLVLFIFDACLTQLIYQAAAREAWLTLTDRFERNTLGSSSQKNGQLTQLYIAHRPDIIFLQEADRSLAQMLCEVDYFISPDSQDRLKGQGKTIINSIIFYKKGVSSPSQISRLEIDKGEIEEKGDKNLDRLLTNEVCINRVVQDKEISLFVSSHAASLGNDTIPFFQLLFQLKKKIAEESKKSVLLFIDADTNISPQRKGRKQYLPFVEEVLVQEGYQIVKQAKEATTDKERSYLQVQYLKAYERVQDQSDLIIIPSGYTVDSSYLSHCGPGPDNPSDHSLLIASVRDFLKKSKKNG